MNPAILLWLAMMLFAAYKGFEFLGKYTNKPISCEGKLIEKEYASEWKGLPRRRYLKFTYWFVFEVNEKRLTLFCDGNDYDRLNVGDIVKITYSGEMLLKFEKASD